MSTAERSNCGMKARDSGFMLVMNSHILEGVTEAIGEESEEREDER